MQAIEKILNLSEIAEEQKSQLLKTKRNEFFKNMVVVSKNNVTQARFDSEKSKISGTYYTDIPAHAYARGMLEETAEFLLQTRAKYDLLDVGFVRELYQAHFDNGRFAEEKPPP